MEFMSRLQNGNDDLKPAIFELLSEQQLAALIPPSLRYLLTVATHRNPRYLLRILNSFDEIYSLLTLAVERHFLRTYGGSFTENFYGLKRERVLRIKGGEAPRAEIGAPELMRESLKLNNTDIWKNLMILVGLPYLKRKLDESFEIYGAQQSSVIQMGPNYRRDELPPDATMKQRLFWYYKWFLRKVYPSVNAAYYFSLLTFNLAYLFDNTKYSSPFLWLIGTRIRRLNEADYRAIALATDSSSSKPVKTGPVPRQTTSLFNPITFSRIVLPQLLSSLKLLLPASIFALKFLEWWHASDFAHQLSKKAVEGIDLPPPLVSGLPRNIGQSLRPSSAKDKFASPEPSLPTNSVALSSESVNANPSPTLPISTPPTSQSDGVFPLQTSTRPEPPVSSLTNLPIHTVAAPTPSTSSLCPICRHPIQTPTSAQTGFVFCYTCIFRWIDGSHERQIAFMEGRKAGDWDDEEEEGNEEKDAAETGGVSREGKWESGKGRCAVTGRRVLGGTDGLRRVMA